MTSTRPDQPLLFVDSGAPRDARGPIRTGLALIAALATLIVAPSARADSAPDAGTPFEPQSVSKPIYGTQPPAADPVRQTHVVTAADGVEIYVETWLPAAKNGNVPPARVPVILRNTPYAELVYGSVLTGPSSLVAAYTSRGYAFATAHVRGTGRSGGCLEQTEAKQIDDGARVIEYLGRDAPFSDGNVGMAGTSYDAETQISVAAFGDPARTKYLKAIVPVSSVLSQYEYVAYDGVPYSILDGAMDGLYLVNSLSPAADGVNPHLAQKPGCQPAHFSTAADLSGDMTPYWMAREYRPGLENVRAAVLSSHGLADWNVRPVALAGFFDQLPATTPHKGLFGVWGHGRPEQGAVVPEWNRADFIEMTVAWYDRWLRGARTGVESWPDVQVQDSRGQWRAEPDFPTTGGPAGALVLGAAGTLGATAPSGSSSFSQLSQLEGAVLVSNPSEDNPVSEPERAAGVASFTTPALSAPLHLTGQPVLDLWVRLSEPDAHVAAVLDVLDADGNRIPHLFNFGLRSARHLDPIADGWFRQEKSKDAPVGTPVRVLVRMHPTDMVVPAGARLRLSLAGTAFAFTPSGSAADVEVLHDCQHPSALRFLMPRENARLLNVREADEPAGQPLPANPVPALETDGGGLATAAACGRAPERIDLLGPERTDVDETQFGTQSGPTAAPPRPLDRILAR